MNRRASSSPSPRLARAIRLSGKSTLLPYGALQRLRLLSLPYLLLHALPRRLPLPHHPHRDQSSGLLLLAVQLPPPGFLRTPGMCQSRQPLLHLHPHRWPRVLLLSWPIHSQRTLRPSAARVFLRDPLKKTALALSCVSLFPSAPINTIADSSALTGHCIHPCLTPSSQEAQQPIRSSGAGSFSCPILYPAPCWGL
jgi:hypothetical protein